MKKSVMTLMAAAVMMTAMTMTVFAGEWKQDAKGWWWQNDNGGYANSGWEWLDGNRDGVAECYFFGSDGYLLVNTIVEGQYAVNADGAWVTDGVVQTKAAETAAGTHAQEQAAQEQAAQEQATQEQAAQEQTQKEAQSQAQYSDDYSGIYQVPYYEMDGNVSTQTLIINYDAASNSILLTNSRFGTSNRYTYGGKDFRGYTLFELITEDVKDALIYLAPGEIEWWQDDESVGIARQ